MFSREDHSSLWIFLDDHGIIAVLSSGLHCTLWITSVCVYWPQAPLFNITSSSLQHRGIVLLLLCWSPTCVITSRVTSRDTATARSAWGISSIHNTRVFARVWCDQRRVPLTCRLGRRALQHACGIKGGCGCELSNRRAIYEVDCWGVLADQIAVLVLSDVG